MDPAYSFAIPSIEDDTILDCRIYHPKDLDETLSSCCRGVVVAHPYAPLGGSQNDAVVLEITSCLLSQGYIVGTFNFRGAGDSQGKTSWTGKGEKDDYMSFAGFLVHYLRELQQHHNAEDHVHPHTELILAGYSYGSLILSQLPPLAAMMHPFETAQTSTSAAVVILRAKRLASDTAKAWHGASSISTRGRNRPSSAENGQAKALTVTLGGEETNPKRRLSRESRDGRRGLEAVKKSIDVPHRIAAHIRRRSSSGASKSRDRTADAPHPVTDHDQPCDVRVRYLLVSPLLPPLASVLVSHHSMGSWFGRHNDSRAAGSGFGSLSCRSLVIWGTDDMFTSHRRLRAWAERIKANAPSLFAFAEIDGAGHFWREQNAMEQLVRTVKEWDRAEKISSPC